MLAKYFEVAREWRITLLTDTLADVQAAKIKANKAKPTGVSQAQSKKAA